MALAQNTDITPLLEGMKEELRGNNKIIWYFIDILGENIECVLVGISNVSIEIPSIKVTTKISNMKVNLISKQDQIIIEANLGTIPLSIDSSSLLLQFSSNIIQLYYIYFFRPIFSTCFSTCLP